MYRSYANALYQHVYNQKLDNVLSKDEFLKEKQIRPSEKVWFLKFHGSNSSSGIFEKKLSRREYYIRAGLPILQLSRNNFN